MTQESEFERLEEFVKKLLGRFDLLRHEKIQLESTLQQKEKEIEELKAKLALADNERGDISLRVKGLLAQIDEWEKDIVEDLSLKKIKMTYDEGPSKEEDALKILDGRRAEEKEKSLQQNLFNVRPRSDGMAE